MQLFNTRHRLIIPIASDNIIYWNSKQCKREILLQTYRERERERYIEGERERNKEIERE